MQHSEIEYKLKEHRLGHGFYRPNYSGFGLANLPPSILASLGCRWDGPAPLNRNVFPIDSGRNTVVLILVDALGWNLLKKSRNQIGHLMSLMNDFTPMPLTTVFPSTTSTVLTTLNTATTPAKHGIVGYSMYIKELGAICNMLDFKIINAPKDESIFEKGFAPDMILGVPTIYQRLLNQGVQSYVLTKNYLLNSGLSRATHAGAGAIGYVDVGDMFVILRKLLEREVNRPKYVFVYWPSVDTTSHTFGPWSEETLAEMRSFFFSFGEEFLSKVSSEAKRDMLVLITGDHGHSSIRNGGVYDVLSDKYMMNMLTLPPTGDSRASFLHLKNGKVEEAIEYLSGMADNGFHSVLANDLRKEELLGSDALKPGLLDKLGDLLVLPEAGRAIFYPFKNEKTFTQKGSHAGLTDDELFVPLFSVDFGP
ncbi:MAG: alkaline phosphatase family protein [Conexivisphaerales archaeon]